MQKIDTYSFGSMTVNGETFRRDLIVFPGKVLPEWWREKGHSLSLDDLKAVLAYAPDVLIIGRGAMRMMKVPDDVKTALKAKNIECITGATGKMVDIFNAHMEKGNKTVGAFHLTC